MKARCLEPGPAATRPADAPGRLGVSAACLAARTEARTEAVACAGAEHPGHLEAQLAADGRESCCGRRLSLGRKRKRPRRPRGQRALTRPSAGHDRTFATRFGEATVRRTRGHCPKCRKWRMPADEARGPAETAGCSPAVREMTALLASRMPVGEAGVVLGRLTGLKAPRAAPDREARRQGGRAQALRRELDAHPGSPARQRERPPEPRQMIPPTDAWNIRERDPWGASAAGRKTGGEPQRRHGVHAGTCFRPDHRAQTAGGRPVIAGRGFAATREGTDALREQPHAGAWARPPAPWSSPPGRSGSGGWLTTGFRKRASGWILVTPCSTSPPRVGRALAGIRPGCGRGSNPAGGGGKTRRRSRWSGRWRKSPPACRPRAGGHRCPDRGELLPRASGADGSPRGQAARRALGQRSRRGGRPPIPVPLQASGPVLESPRRRSPPLLPRNLLAQRPRASPLPPRSPLRPCKKLRCAPSQCSIGNV